MVLYYSLLDLSILYSSITKDLAFHSSFDKIKQWSRELDFVILIHCRTYVYLRNIKYFPQLSGSVGTSAKMFSGILSDSDFKFCRGRPYILLPVKYQVYTGVNIIHLPFLLKWSMNIDLLQ